MVPSSSQLPEPVRHLIAAATPVLRIHGVGGVAWTRNVAKGSRIGPWRQGRFDVLDAAAWARGGACLYLVTAQDGGLRYVGISRNGLKHRWRTSPARSVADGTLLPEWQLFHSQCWKHVEAEFAADAGARFEVRCLDAATLVQVLRSLDDPIRALATLADDGETVVMAVERWICNRASASLARWNVAMTARRPT